MKFLYEFRSSDNVRHEGVVCATSREAAFSALKEQGIRPGRMTEAPGFFNKLFGKGKRWTAIFVLATLSVIAVAYAFGLKRQIGEDVFVPSQRYVELERDVMDILAKSPYDIDKARGQVRELFKERYMTLGEDARERQAAQTLYGSVLLRLESMEEEHVHREKDF